MGNIETNTAAEPKSTIAPTTTGTVRRMLKSVTKHCLGDKDNMELSFEFIIGSLFPDAFDNYLSQLKDVKMKGFAEGYAAAQEEMKARETQCESKE